MLIEIFADNLTDKDKSSNINRSARAIIVKDNEIMFLYSKTLDYYMLPGGGIEENELEENCVIREVKEETGFSASLIKKTLVIREYFPDSTWETHYFLVELIGDKPGDRSLTEEEKELELDIKWVKVEEALMLLDSYDSSYYKANNIMSREFLAIINSI
jgi:8-oxo-dGTP diphosphatase